MRKMKMLSITLAAILIALISQSTIAYYTTIGKATNVVTSGDIELKIHEKTTGDVDFPEEGVTVIPGDKVEKKVTIENICDHPFYLRVKLVNGIDSTELSVAECFDVNIDRTNWIEEDGWLYYKEIVNPGEITSEIFTEVVIVGDKVDNEYIGKALNLTVTAQAVQSEHNSAANPWDAQGWPEE